MQADRAGFGAVDDSAERLDETSAARRSAGALAALLLVGGIVAGLAPLFGVVSAADGSPIAAVALAAWVAVLPGLTAVGLTLVRPELGLAATAGGGLMTSVRLIADLALIAELDGLARPELFWETTNRARPFALGAGAWVLIAADALMVVAGLIAAGRLVGVLGLPSRIGDDLVLGPSPTPSSGGRAAAEGGTSASAEALTNAAPRRTNLNVPMISVGFAGGVLVMLSSLEIPYTGGYLDLRILPLGTSLFGVLAAAAAPLVAGFAVVVAAALPRAAAIALMVGTAVAAAVPSLTAAVAVPAGAPTALAAGAWWGLLGAVVLALSGLLARRSPRRVQDDDRPVVRSTGVPSVAVGILALAGAGLALAAARMPLLLMDGGAPADAIAQNLEPSRWPFIPAAVPLLVAGALALVSPTRRLGWSAAAVVWAGPVYALAMAFAGREAVVSSAQNPLIVAELPESALHEFSAGPGLWLGALAAAFAVAAAVLAVVALRRDADASLQVAVDESVSASQAPRRWIAAALTTLAVVALSLPVYSYGRSASVTLWSGAGLDTWGVWAVGLAIVGALWTGAGARHRAIAATLPAAAATVAVQPLILPGAVTGQPGFEHGAGFWAGSALVAALLLAAPVFAALAARMRTVDARTWRAGWSSGAEAPAARDNREVAARGRKAGRT